MNFFELHWKTNIAPLGKVKGEVLGAHRKQRSEFLKDKLVAFGAQMQSIRQQQCIVCVCKHVLIKIQKQTAVRLCHALTGSNIRLCQRVTALHSLHTYTKNDD